MANLYQGYPSKIETKKLKRIINEYTEELYASRANINTVIQLSPLIQLGQSELQGRQNRRIEVISTIISLTSLIIAIGSIYIAIQSDASSNRWEKNQGTQLNTLDKHNKQLIERMDSIVEINKRLISTAKSLINDSIKVRTVNKKTTAKSTYPKLGH